MKAYVSSIRPHHAGFGQFQRDDEVAVDGDWESVDEYACHVTTTNPLIKSYGLDPDVAAMGDDDGVQISEKIREVNGSVLGGHDVIVVYWMGDDDMIVESVRLDE